MQISGCEELLAVELLLVGEEVRVRVGGDREVALTDELGDAGPRHAAQVQERDAPVSQVVRRPKRQNSPPRFRNRLELPPEQPSDDGAQVSHDVDGASGEGCLGWYSPSSPPPGSRIAVRRPNPSSLTGPGISAPREPSSATVALTSSHMR